MTDAEFIQMAQNTRQGDGGETGRQQERLRIAQESYEQGVRDGEGAIVRYLMMTVVFVVFVLGVLIAWGWWG